MWGDLLGFVKLVEIQTVAQGPTCVSEGLLSGCISCISGQLCAARSVDRWGWWIPRFFFSSSPFLLYLLSVSRPLRVESLLKSAGSLGLIAVAADRFSLLFNVSVFLRKLRCGRSLVAISVIGSVYMDLR
jgi:hypothetical protein